jgi:peptide/nickel transport system substrate-binding protein
MALGLTAVGCSPGGGQANEGGERVYVEAINPMPHFNPAIRYQPSIDQVGGSVYEPLVRMSDDFELVPWLARSWEFSEDNLSLTLHLEEDVRWQDGESFTSADVKFNFDEIMPLQMFGTEMVEAIESVEAPDEKTVVVNLKHEYGPLMPTLSMQYLLPRHLYEGTDVLTNAANMKPVGTGALVIEKFDEASEIVATANPDYWAGDLQFDRVILPVTNDANARDLALMAGDIDRSRYVGISKRAEFDAQPTMETSLRGSVPQFVQFVMNPENEILSDPAVRSLVFQAVDRAKIVEVALPTTSTEPVGIYPEALDWANTPGFDFSEAFPYDVEDIAAGLDAAGYPTGPDGVRFTLRLQFQSILPDLVATADVMKASMAAVGIELDLIGEDQTVFHEKVTTAKDFDTAIILGTTSQDPSLALVGWYTCNPESAWGRNPTALCDPEIDESAAGARDHMDRKERATYMHALQDRAVEVMFTAPLAFTSGLLVYNTARWEGVENPRNLIGPMDWLALKPKD